MGKQEIYNKVLSLIEEETEVSRDLILSGNKQEEVVDARALLVYTLYEIGFYPPQISTLTGICGRCINPFILNFGERKNCRILHVPEGGLLSGEPVLAVDQFDLCG